VRRERPTVEVIKLARPQQAVEGRRQPVDVATLHVIPPATTATAATTSGAVTKASATGGNGFRSRGCGARRASEFLFSLHAELGECHDGTFRPSRENPGRPHEFTTDSIQPILSDGPRNIIRGFKRVLNTKPVSIPSILIQATNVNVVHPSFTLLGQMSSTYRNDGIIVLEVVRIVPEKVDEELAYTLKVG